MISIKIVCLEWQITLIEGWVISEEIVLTHLFGAKLLSFDKNDLILTSK